MSNSPTGSKFNMNAAEVLRQLRSFLLVLSVLLFGGAIVELWLVGHTDSWLQWIPFVLSLAGSIASLIVLFRTQPKTVGVLRVCMVVIMLGTLFGIYQHVAGNLALEREINPGASTARLVKRGLQGGNPLLAPGIPAIAALLALSATYRFEITTGVAGTVDRADR
jgi:hypothetical protein